MSHCCPRAAYHADMCEAAVPQNKGAGCAQTAVSRRCFESAEQTARPLSGTGAACVATCPLGWK